MNFFRTAKFSVERCLEVESYQQEYTKQLLKHPMVASSVICGELFRKLEGCLQQKGEDDQECQLLRLQTLGCTASMFAPAEYERWAKCLEKDDSPDGCQSEATAAVTAAERRYEEVSHETLNSLSKTVVDGLKKCGFPGDSPDEEDSKKILNCVAPVVCGDQVRLLSECVEKNGGEYGASACHKHGIAFAQCFGDAMANAAMREELSRK